MLQQSLGLWGSRTDEIWVPLPEQFFRKSTFKSSTEKTASKNRPRTDSLELSSNTGLPEHWLGSANQRSLSRGQFILSNSFSWVNFLRAIYSTQSFHMLYRKGHTFKPKFSFNKKNPLWALRIIAICIAETLSFYQTGWLAILTHPLNLAVCPSSLTDLQD